MPCCSNVGGRYIIKYGSACQEMSCKGETKKAVDVNYMVLWI